MVITIHPTAIATLAEFFEQAVHINTVQDRGQDPALADTIADCEDVGVQVIPLNISKLVKIDNKKKRLSEEH